MLRMDSMIGMLDDVEGWRTRNISSCESVQRFATEQYTLNWTNIKIFIILQYSCEFLFESKDLTYRGHASEAQSISVRKQPSLSLTSVSSKLVMTSDLLASNLAMHTSIEGGRLSRTRANF